MSSGACFINVAVTLPLHNTFTYRVPGDLADDATPGKRVLAPFNRRRLTGYILGPDVPADPCAIKQILDILDDRPVFPAAMIPFFRWIADYYMHPIGEVIKTALPGGMIRQDTQHLAITEEGRQALAKAVALPPLPAAILKVLQDRPLTRRQLAGNLNQETPLALLRRLERQRWITCKTTLSTEAVRPKQERYVRLTGNATSTGRVSEARTRLLRALAYQQPVRLRTLRALTPSASRILKAYQADGVVDIFNQTVLRDPLGDPVPPDRIPLPSLEQHNVISSIAAQLENGFQTFLLTGVTGSGKTEVYLQLTARVRARQEKVLVLVPEIALIAHMARAFRARFGDQVAVLHSGLSAGERFDQWHRLLEGDAGIAIGARSAVFAPWTRTGLIIVDEEHDTSYKQESGLRYQARDLAVVRARLDGCVALLGSATPSVQSYFNAQNGKYAGLQMTRRVEDRALPQITLVDLRRQVRDRPGDLWLSPPLRQAMAQTLARREQVLLFLNRRGFANLALCAACGKVLTCRHCNVSMTFHKAADRFNCHYCGYSLAAAGACPECRAVKFKLLGMGTEKIQQMARGLFPEARIARMDRDTTRAKGALLKLLRGLRQQTIDLLVGTQMVAKGHDFPNITLVGIICADLSLNIPDFRASERTFQLLAQVAGRAGRGDVPGQVILQTFTPDHFSITTARDQDYRAFYDQEIAFRHSLGYPPFSRLIALKISGRRAEITRQAAQALGQQLQHAAVEAAASIQVLGPVEATVARVADHYRWQIILKSPHTAALQQLVRQGVLHNPDLTRNRNVQVAVDVDPYFF